MEEKKNEVITIPYIVYENSENRHEKKEKRLLWCIIIPLILALFVSNMTWLYVFQSYDYATYEYSQDGEGHNSINTGQGDINNGAAIESQEQDKKITQRVLKLKGVRKIDKILKSKKASLKQIKTKQEYEKYVSVLKLTVEQRLIMQMVFVEGYHYSYIADNLGYSESTIKHKVRKILEQL